MVDRGRDARHGLRQAGPPLDRRPGRARLGLAQPARQPRLAPARRAPHPRSRDARGRDPRLGLRCDRVDRGVGRSRAAGRARGGGWARAAPRAALETWVMDADAELGKLLAARGWAAADEPHYTHWYRRLD